jgi:hypothetical protein
MGEWVEDYEMATRRRDDDKVMVKFHIGNIMTLITSIVIV